MKALAILLLAIFSLFSVKGQMHVSRLPTVNQNIATNAGISNGAGSCHAKQVNSTDAQSYLPDSSCTPGVTNSNVTQDTIDSTICESGFTKTIRPPVSYTDNLKRQQIQQYGYADTNPRDYEEDHFIPLELGGNPNDPKNLWPEPHPSTNEKDLVEDYLNKQVCNGSMPLSQAQKEISQNWYSVYQQKIQ